MKYFTIMVSAVLFFSGCGMPQKTIKRSESIMGTIWDITIVHGDEKAANTAIDEYFAEVRRLEKMLSFRDQKSALNGVNAKAGTGPVKVPPEILTIMQTALYVSELSGGGFDVTIGPVVKLWGFAGGQEKVPSPEEIKAAHALVGYHLLKLDTKNSTLTLQKKGMLLDLGGIAKGYALDRARPILKKYKIKNAMINAGGQVYVTGKNPGGKKWKIGIIHPKKKEGLLGVFEATDKCVATSGNYERYFRAKGKLYHHIFNPFDSFPASDTVSATVMLNAADFEYPNTLADGLSTAVFVAGCNKGLELCGKIKHAGAVIVSGTETGIKLGLSENLKGEIQFNEY